MVNKKLLTIELLKQELFLLMEIATLPRCYAFPIIQFHCRQQ